MNRRNFFKNGSLLTAGAFLMNPMEGFAALNADFEFNQKKAKNIIMLVSDGMSSGTLTMADIFLYRKNGIGSNWLNLYRENLVSRALMDMASASSIVTDSAAASSSWGGGKRVKNGSLNIGENGEEHLPILQKFKQAGKKVGCVTTVPITHATPAGFCIFTKSRNSQELIAEKYLEIEFDVMMGGGDENFNPNARKDQKDLYQLFANKGYDVVKTKTEMRQSITNNQKILGVFHKDALPYSIDRENDENLRNTIPTLAEMTHVAIQKMKDHQKGFVLQVEAGKVDWAAHANDAAGLIYDQIAFDQAVKVAIDFAKENKETLVIITTDHGNANPGLIYGKKANDHFDNLQYFKSTNEKILMSFSQQSSLQEVKDTIKQFNNFEISTEDAQLLLNYYSGLEREDGLYNYRKLPTQKFADIQKKHTSIGWIGNEHSADFTELAMYGPGSQNLKSMIKNTDLHYFMLNAAEVEDKF
ncbi:MAG: alkaline phosphatase [Flavobacterium sp.]|jgi:alkaline phosphatase